MKTFMKIENIYYVRHFTYAKFALTLLGGLSIFLSLVEMSGRYQNFRNLNKNICLLIPSRHKNILILIINMLSAV